ncbi:MAG: hypothetical protein IT364_05705 [Candidatus Hydrogenedentes bacterium]|nr:hypothetical protein [Candidatus Hydrogenedentota bacterium]
MNRLLLFAAMLIPTMPALADMAAAQGAAPSVQVLAEEDVYTFTPPNNGSGPMWSFGCTTIARLGERVVVSEMETGEGVPRLCNTKWRLAERTDSGWKVFAEAEGYRQREPCLLAALSDHEFFLNVNDSLMPPGTEYGPCEPHLLAFDLNALDRPPRKLMPEWAGETYFTDHSYRGYAADPARRELLMLNINAKTSVEHWALLDADGKTLKNGGITFPIRSCYPQVALRNRVGYVLAIGDIVEPNEEWRSYKFEQTQQKWDYVFRILYFTSSPNLMEQDFGPAIEIANVDKTGGHISNQDLWISPEGDAYILYTEREVASALIRDKFVPGGSLIGSLHLAVVKNGEVVQHKVLVQGTETVQPGHARLHSTPDGKVYALLYISGAEHPNQLMQVYPLLENPPTAPVPFKTPFGSYLLASERAGNAPSNIIDVYGHSTSGTTLSYAQVLIE